MRVEVLACQRSASPASVVFARPVIAITLANTSNAKMIRRSSATWSAGFSMAGSRGTGAGRTPRRTLPPPRRKSLRDALKARDRMIMMNVVDRQISARDGDRRAASRRRVEEDERLVEHAHALEDRVQVAVLGEDRRPREAGREIRDRERQDEDVEEETLTRSFAFTSSAIPNASTNWSGTITRISRKREAHRLWKAASCHIVSSAPNVQFPLSSWKREPEALDHRPDEEEREVDERGKDQPVRQTLPPPSPTRERRAPRATVVISPGPRGVSLDHAPALPLGGSGAQQGAFVFTKI